MPSASEGRSSKDLGTSSLPVGQGDVPVQCHRHGLRPQRLDADHPAGLRADGGERGQPHPPHRGQKNHGVRFTGRCGEASGRSPAFLVLGWVTVHQGFSISHISLFWNQQIATFDGTHVQSLTRICVQLRFPIELVDFDLGVRHALTAPLSG